VSAGAPSKGVAACFGAKKDRLAHAAQAVLLMLS